MIQVGLDHSIGGVCASMDNSN